MNGHDFAGEVVAVTGAASGLGRAYAVDLASRGASVVVNDLHAERAAETVAAIVDGGGAAVAVVGSVADPEVADSIAATAVSTFGRLDVLINNAGNGVAGRLTRMSDDAVRSVIDVHVLGTMWVTRAALRVMEQQGDGRIVVTSSAAGAFGISHMPVYCAAKAALMGLTRALALDAAESSIRVNAIAPVADTALSDGFFQRFPQLDRQRYGVAAVVPAVAYLCHRDCPLNGTLLTIGGGRVGRIATVTNVGHYDPYTDVGEITANLDRILSIDHAVEPRSVLDEFLLVDV